MRPLKLALLNIGEAAVSVLMFPFVLLYAVLHFAMVLAPAILVLAALVWAVRFLLGLV